MRSGTGRSPTPPLIFLNQDKRVKRQTGILMRCSGQAAADHKTTRRSMWTVRHAAVQRKREGEQGDGGRRVGVGGLSQRSPRSAIRAQCRNQRCCDYLTRKNLKLCNLSSCLLKTVTALRYLKGYFLTFPDLKKFVRSFIIFPTSQKTSPHLNALHSSETQNTMQPNTLPLLKVG